MQLVPGYGRQSGKYTHSKFSVKLECGPRVQREFRANFPLEPHTWCSVVHLESGFRKVRGVNGVNLAWSPIAT